MFVLLILIREFHYKYASSVPPYHPHVLINCALVFMFLYYVLDIPFRIFFNIFFSFLYFNPFVQFLLHWHEKLLFESNLGKPFDRVSSFSSWKTSLPWISKILSIRKVSKLGRSLGLGLSKIVSKSFEMSHLDNISRLPNHAIETP